MAKSNISPAAKKGLKEVVASFLNLKAAVSESIQPVTTDVKGALYDLGEKVAWIEKTISDKEAEDGE